jgi:hypothetical protein
MTGTLAAQISRMCRVLSVLVVLAAFVVAFARPFTAKRDAAPRLPLRYEDLPSLALTSFHTYESRFKSHSLFFVPEERVAAPGPGADDILAKYEVIGIIEGGQPEAIISNRSNSQSHFVQRGETFDGIELIEIRSHSVVVRLQDEEHELLLT